ncbi:hypothetical protein, partial [Haloferula sp. BvORR071]|uniref:hypothetical protein n=1 Tax=Haloferula sp. BvORR071 TaxID=1396141 RepID=UPI0005536FCB
PGKEVIGSVKVIVYQGTNGDPAAAGPRAKDASAEIAARLTKEQKLKYTKYLELARDHRMLYRSYQNWAEPFQPASDEVMLRFEPQSNLLNNDTMRLDLELWLSRKKILKTDAALTYGKPLFILGPEWKGGRLILSVELSPEKGGKP